MKLTLNDSRHILFAATGCYSGYSPVMPGTAGSIAAIPICLIFMLMPAWMNTLSVAALILFSIWICDQAEKILGEKDPGCIVLDEIAGMVVTLSGVAPGFTNIMAGFVLFRFFDILKPWPIKNLETIFKGGAGIVADDIGAGIYASIMLNVLLINGII
ncbi:phosphatidylglycerophosphatase A family protein [Desulforegula conservatrix]|uniref:phosphatidylglycerophosphatase A family protein n=1 Tax=Desulforegula conservatrix TaxID=153026 RepID=UPI0003F6BB06|nr:phosphatidylglycerophosphatase A [Desulforegula conservatrix]